VTTVPVVTALRARGKDRVAVDLDGRLWRIVPLEAVYAARLAIGGTLDRDSVRALRRELRRVEARTEALRALRARDHTTTSLGQRLAARGTARAVREATIDAVTRAGLIDDQRFATSRAALLANRGAGDLLIADDLERHGVPDTAARIAIAELEPESTRAAAIIEARGPSPRTARYLVAKGFSEATLDPLVADLAADPLG
jgi:SOS response regulatory protein OraA/RecX